jgi:hypothetical protein
VHKFDDEGNNEGLPRGWLKIKATTRVMHNNVTIALQYLAFSQLCRIRHENGLEPIPQQTPTFPSKKPESVWGGFRSSAGDKIIIKIRFKIKKLRKNKTAEQDRAD